MTDRPLQDSVRRLVDVMAKELFGGDIVALDPVDASLARLQDVCFADPSAWDRVADALEAELTALEARLAPLDEATACRRTRLALESLRSLASELTTSADRGEPPTPAAWATMVEFAASELAAEDLERDEGRQVRLTAAFRAQLRELRQQREPFDWSWAALTET